MAIQQLPPNQWLSPEQLEKLSTTALKEPLPPSPCLKSLLNGKIYLWNAQFAARPELYVNCDADGNEDEGVWRAALAKQEAAEPSSPARVGPQKRPYENGRLLSSRDLASLAKLVPEAPRPAPTGPIQDDPDLVPSVR
jgi:hypothetical protein